MKCAIQSGEFRYLFPNRSFTIVELFDSAVIFSCIIHGNDDSILESVLTRKIVKRGPR